MSDSVQKYQGTQAIVYFDGGKCIHARHCVLGQPGVFQANAPGDWIQPDQASPAALAEVAHNCPSGAITVEFLSGETAETAPPVNVIRIRENGPLAVHAAIAIGGQAAGTRATLCRCGASAHKPYCDGSHSAAGFVATGEPATQECEPLAVRDGALNISPIPNGPLMVDGNVEICAGTGRMVNRTQKAFLCRCGASDRKPYCDGSHRKIGFVG